jgi:hypothetical protein
MTAPVVEMAAARWPRLRAQDGLHDVKQPNRKLSE